MKKIISAVVMAAAVALTGCATTEVGNPIYQGTIDQIKKGETTRDNIILMFGQPQTVTVDQEGNTIYSYVHSTGSYNGFTGKMAGGAQTLSVIIGPDNKVKSYSHSTSQLPQVRSRMG